MFEKGYNKPALKQVVENVTMMILDDMNLENVNAGTCRNNRLMSMAKATGLASSLCLAAATITYAYSDADFEENYFGKNGDEQVSGYLDYINNHKDEDGNIDKDKNFNDLLNNYPGFENSVILSRLAIIFGITSGTTVCVSAIERRNNA